MDFYGHIILFKRQVIQLLLSVLWLLLIPIDTQAQTGKPNYNSDPSVHDPSVIKVGDRYYVYGSHGASAWTEDLRNWTQVADSVTSGNPVHFQNIWAELSDLKSWIPTASTLWAPDVIQLPDGKYYYYYCLWDGRGYMGVATADTVEGPYKHLARISRTGESGYNANIHPNTIDPTVFYDVEDRLWMVYGSYSGGIYILEMDETTGLPLPDQGWGTHLWGGNHSRIEGPYILYSPDTEYYYLFVSYFGLAADDDYNIRVARSRNPDGPYLDSEGNDMAVVKSDLSKLKWETPYPWDDASIAPYGVLLMGSHRFAHVTGEPSSMSIGYKAPGHNSALYDAEKDKYYLFCHTRFLNGGEAHQVRVYQIYFNEDGWPVVAPHRYAGERLRNYRTDTIAGYWKVIEHGPKDYSPAVVNTSELVILNSNGSVSGAKSGTWEMVSGHDIRLTLHGTGYRGVVSHQYDFNNKVWVLAFSAMSPDGIALWGSQVAVDRSSLESFRYIHFGSIANTGEGADSADPNDNCVPNLMEYALQANPLADNAEPLKIRFEDNKLSMQFNTIKDPELTYSILNSSDLNSTGSAWSSTGSNNKIDTISYEDSSDVRTNPRRFIQLRVSR